MQPVRSHCAARSRRRFDRERVDLKTKRTSSGGNLSDLTPKGYVPVLVLDDGEVLTENVAVLDWIASLYPALGGSGSLGRARIIEALTCIATEIHGHFKPFWHVSSDAEKIRAANALSYRFELFADTLRGKYLFGDTPTVADFYLFVMLLWAARFGVHVPDALVGLRERVAARPATQAAMRAEGLLEVA